jgi:CubicO group peptidase (beta-lactamase class C family)
MPKLICFIVLIISLSSASAQNQNNVYSKATEDTIKMVENGLSGDVQIQDSINTWNIEERMKAKGVNGVSIAMIRDYKIVWAKGYGLADKASIHQ